MGANDHGNRPRTTSGGATTGAAFLQRLARSGDSAEAVQPDELQGTVRVCHRNRRAAVTPPRQTASARSTGNADRLQPGRPGP